MSTPNKVRSQIYFDVWRPGEEDRSYDNGNEPATALRITFGETKKSFPFFKEVMEIYEFKTEVIKRLSLNDFFYENASRAPEGLPGAVGKLSYDFLVDAMEEDDLKAFVELLDGAQDQGVEEFEVFTLYAKFPPFPWSLLHPRKPSPSAPSATGFLGYRFLLFSPPLSDSGQDLPHDDDAAIIEPAYGLIDDSSLRAVRRYIERRSLNALAGAKFKPLEVLPIPTNPEHEDPEPANVPAVPGFTNRVAKYLSSREWSLVHVACHGDLRAPRAQKNFLRVRNWQIVRSNELKDEIQREDMVSSTNKTSAKLLFLNVCYSVPSAKLSNNGFETLSPTVTISTLGKICDRYAAELATSFFDKAIPCTGSRRRCGSAFQAALRERLEQTLNPAHLLFIYQGFPEVALS